MSTRTTSSDTNSLRDTKQDIEIDDEEDALQTKGTHKMCGLFVMMVALMVGALSITRSGVNIHLALWSGHPLRSCWIQFMIGALTLFPMCFIVKPPKHDTKIFDNLKAELKADKKNWFVILNGTCGILWVCSSIYIAPQIGFSLFAISVIIGQITGSMLIDHFGLIWSNVKKLSLFNLGGAFIAISGVVIFQLPRLLDSEQAVDALLFIYVILAIMAGMAFTAQAALNRRLKSLMQSSPYQSSFLSFLNGSIVLLFVNIALNFIEDDWFEVDHDFLFWYIFMGGVLGGVIVTLYIICPEYIGFVATYICAISGSLAISIIYDYFDVFGLGISGGDQIQPLKIVGMLCVFSGALMVNIKGKPKGYKNPPEAVRSASTMKGVAAADDDEDDEDEVEHEHSASTERTSLNIQSSA